MTDFVKKQNEYVNLFNAFAKKSLEKSAFEGRLSPGLDRMLEAMSYSLENGGKRIRPVLTMEFCRLCGGKAEAALPFALAVEMIHTYSLIHDDLPCMDNDDMRRGKPSNHIVFGYADALLAGDGLLTLAFEELAKADLDAEKIVKAVALLSGAAGCSGMVAGQVMDLQNEKIKAPIEAVKKTDELKTGEMICVASVLGCVAAGADAEKIKAAQIFSKKIGLAFQVVDDILDVTGTEDELGKPIGSDKENEKSTYVSLLGPEEASAFAEKLTNEAIEALSVFDDNEFIIELAQRLIHRKN